MLSVGDAASTPHLADGSVALVVTSPPFLNVIAYRTDHWLRSWFCGITRDELHLSLMGNLDAWRTKMTDVLREQHRLLRPSGHVAFEVGEVRKGALRLEAEVPSCGRAAGLVPIAVVIQDTSFTKTANCWGIANNKVGTNSNRIIVFRKDG